METNYTQQLINSAKEQKLTIPEGISNTLGAKLDARLQIRAKGFMPLNVFYAKSVDHRKYLNDKHCINFRTGDWHFEILAITERKTGKDYLVAVIKKEGSCQLKSSARDKKNGNTPKIALRK